MNNIQGTVQGRKSTERRAARGAHVAVFCFLALATPARTDEKSMSAPPYAKSLIEIWLWGGPSQLETFDPKPDAGRDYNNGLKAIPTNVAGVYISELLPNLSQHADKYALVRSMTHGINAHETATYLMQTGRPPDNTVYPSIGAVIGMMKGYDHGYTGKIPPYVVLTQAKGRFSETGFLNPRYRPLVTGGDPNAAVFAVEGIVTHGVSKDQHLQKRVQLNELDTLGRFMPGNEKLKAFDQAGEEAYELITGDAGSVFDLSRETDDVRDSYGRNTFGQACLAARRLVEAGVPSITVNFNGWDTHKRHFETLRLKMTQLDQGLGALLDDLHERGLLENTIVCCYGEFGRTPKIDWDSPWNGGRSHFGNCFSVLIAGGGFKGGQVVGKSDAHAENVVSRPVYPQDLLGSIYERMGIDPDAKLPNPMGKDLTSMPPESQHGRLREIYAR